MFFREQNRITHGFNAYWKEFGAHIEIVKIKKTKVFLSHIDHVQTDDETTIGGGST